MPDFSQENLDAASLRLRPLEHSDAEAPYAIHSDPEVMKYSTIRPWSSVEQAHELVESTLAAMRAGRHLCFGIVPISAGRVVGTCTLFHIYKASRRAEVGFVLGKPFWGRGYMTEALSALFDYGFSTLDMNRVEADTDPRNLAAARLLERLGFIKEGLLREGWIVDGAKSDSAMYGLLRNAWKAKCLEHLGRSRPVAAKRIVRLLRPGGRSGSMIMQAESPAAWRLSRRMRW